eukprot:TRINITY_DN5216_c0_g1_i1.p1 TRINITY_DN5216_c0_g1~~TRINITY_DN5216_c0_g1_i1.p1  ORF type:complete len:189 (-),score=63.39 TRINITY_DN5216_c0_g1_i1:77-598(-)
MLSTYHQLFPKTPGHNPHEPQKVPFSFSFASQTPEGTALSVPPPFLRPETIQIEKEEQHDHSTKKTLEKKTPLEQKGIQLEQPKEKGQKGVSRKLESAQKKEKDGQTKLVDFQPHQIFLFYPKETPANPPFFRNASLDEIQTDWKNKKGFLTVDHKKKFKFVSKKLKKSVRKK